MEDVKNAKACTILIKGPNQHTIDQARGVDVLCLCVKGERVCVCENARTIIHSYTLPF